MQIRLLHHNEMQKARSLWDLCFDDNPTAFSDWFFTSKYSPETTLGAFEGEQLVGSVQMLPYCFTLRGAAVSGASIAGVCTHPQLRGRGVAGKLMGKANDCMRAMGHQVATLYPSVSYDFYRKLGWEVATQRLRMAFDADQLLAPRTAHPYQVQPIVQPTLPLLDTLYQQQIQPLSLAARRTPQQWTNRYSEICSDGGQGIALMQGSHAAGYAWFHLDGGKLETDELAYDSPQAAHALVRALATMAGSLVLQAPVQSALPLLLRDGRNQVMLEPFLMARAVDLPALLGKLPWRRGAQPFSLMIEDANAPWQHGAWDFIPTGDGHIGMAAVSPNGTLPRVHIGSLMQWVCGFQCMEDLHALGRLEGTTTVAKSMDFLLPIDKTGGFEMY